MIIDGVPFALRRHLERLRRSAAALGLTMAWTDDQLRAAIGSLVTSNNRNLRRLRLIVTGGSNSLGSMRDVASRSTVIIALTPLAEVATTSSVVMVPWTRNPTSAIAELKTTSYAENVVALASAKEKGGDEAIFADTSGNLSEGTGSNIFIVQGGRLVTPGLDTGCLAGVTRALVLELSGADEASVPLGALASADEAFLTSTTRFVQPIAAVDGVGLPASPGPITEKVAQAFTELIGRDLDP